MSMKLNISEERRKRYTEKLAHARERLLDLEEWLPNSDKISILASEKAFQEAIESLTDIFAMLLSDMKLPIGDDYFNIEKISDRKIISQEQAKLCSEANGLRNFIVHRYNHVDENRFVETAQRLAPLLQDITDKLDDYIKNEPN